MRLQRAASAAIATALLAFAAVQGATSSTGEQDDVVARIYLSPAAGSSEAATVSPIQLNSILSHHFDVPDEELGLAASNKAVWQHLSPDIPSSTDAVHGLFGQAKKRTAILISGLSHSEADDVMPDLVRHTHDLVAAPKVSASEVTGLLHSYGERLFARVSDTTRGVFGFKAASLPKESELALEGTDEILACLKRAQAEVKAANLSSSITSLLFYESMRSFLANVVSIREEDAAAIPFHAVHFGGLDDMRKTYGVESEAYQQAKVNLQELLRVSLPSLMCQSKADASSSNVALIVMPGTMHDMQLTKRADPLWPFRSSIAMTPFLRARAAEDENSAVNKEGIVGHYDSELGSKIFSSDATAAKGPQESDAPKRPKEADYIGKCFSSEGDLNSATANCSSHGDAYQTSKGGKQCYRCKCKVTKGDNGKLTQWAGDACQKIDISKEFVLLGTTTIALLVVALGSVYYLYNEGQQELPSVLAGITIPNK